MISSRTYTVLARRDLEIAGISIALIIHSLDPTNVGASVRLETAPTGPHVAIRRSGDLYRTRYPLA